MLTKDETKVMTNFPLDLKSASVSHVFDANIFHAQKNVTFYIHTHIYENSEDGCRYGDAVSLMSIMSRMDSKRVQIARRFS